ncbi:MAG: hypothetical protein NTX50_21050 [Candidatus Sumerlaeota bacterium]|nr:hypothetical protein [Candidatus Sumerlaeota bacterium]
MIKDKESSRQIKHDTNYHLLLERGRRFKINFGDHSWEAVYWGSDETAALVAYQAGKHWQFTHYDLNHMTGKLIVGEMLSLSEIQAIERDYIAGHPIVE